MKNYKFVVITLMSISIIALEIVWTRIFSAEFFYTFAFLTLSLAILGLGLGGLALRLFKSLNNEKYLGPILSLTGLAALAGPPLVLRLGLKFSSLVSEPIMIFKLTLAILLLGLTFFLAGIALAMLFRSFHKEMPRLYMADLIGAGGGVLFSIILMNQLGTPAATFICAVPILLAALISSSRYMKVLPGFIIIGAILFSVYSVPLLDVPKPDRAPVIYKHWDAMAKIKIYDYGDESRGINVDNVANSGLIRFDGNWDRPDSMRFNFGIEVNDLIDQFDSCTFLSLGSGGGGDVLQALQAGATEIYAVEVNPFINHMMLYGDSSGYIPQIVSVSDSEKVETGAADSIKPIITTNDFTGNIYSDPRVNVVSEDARAFMRRYNNKFDVIYSLSSNTWAALASGSFALAENYLFTTEAFQDYWLALSDSGYMMMEHQFYMPRLVSEVIDALNELGVEDIGSHFAVYDLPQARRNALLLSKRPLTDSLRYYALDDLTPELYPYLHLLYPAPDSLQDNLINRIVQNGWQNEADSERINLSPCTDDKPFVAQMGLWKNFSFDNLERVLPYEFMGFPLSKVIFIIILIIVVVIILPLNLIPYFTKGEKLKFAPWLYFFLIGMAYMAVEVILIQKYTLFVGPSVYSIAVILVTLLVASGIGSRFSKKISNPLVFLGIVVWILLDIFVFRFITNSLSGLTMYPRIIVTIILFFPLGFFMGMPFPKGTLRVGQLIDWGFAVNGAASVLGSTLILLVAFAFGFNIALMAAAGLYLLAFALLSAKTSW